MLGAPVEPRALPHGDVESTVLALAAAEGGRVTIPEVAAKTPLNLDESEIADLVAFLETLDGPPSR